MVRWNHRRESAPDLRRVTSLAGLLSAQEFLLGKASADDLALAAEWHSASAPKGSAAKA
ncbi:hypothetical protein P3102_31110 [Amycolatopsis sp. QT-25]|uniref:hypothetical protein n=1 Tax=Amycolatopsis sp. QT-25 TaxID=3034022 RepID=UPI0023ECB880|nr:hypothetical protein [Amycolatopsis sp. QT-25]WET78468.1 hypothetical protein P3102_31110 [Amycolatopsis sp. QT-25]